MRLRLRLRLMIILRPRPRLRLRLRLRQKKATPMASFSEDFCREEGEEWGRRPGSVRWF